jgi:hypothetical protein
VPAEGVKRWCGRKSNERRKRGWALDADYINIDSLGKGGKQRNKSSGNGGSWRELVRMQSPGEDAWRKAMHPESLGLPGVCRIRGRATLSAGGVPGSLSGGSLGSMWSAFISRKQTAGSHSLRRATPSSLEPHAFLRLPGEEAAQWLRQGEGERISLFACSSESAVQNTPRLTALHVFRSVPGTCIFKSKSGLASSEHGHPSDVWHMARKLAVRWRL